MPAVKMFITKFGREVLIDDEHPLAVAEKAAATEQVRVRDEGRAAQKRKQGR